MIECPRAVLVFNKLGHERMRELDIKGETMDLCCSHSMLMSSVI
jgi:hypothetical protein